MRRMRASAAAMAGGALVGTPASCGGDDGSGTGPGTFDVRTVRALPDEVIVPMVADGEVACAELGVIRDLAPDGQQRPGRPGGCGTGRTRTAEPEAILALLAAATGDVETVGGEDVRGEPATHLRARIDLATAREQSPEDHRAMIDDLAGEGDAQVDEVPVDVWVGEDGLIRRFAVEIERDVPVSTDSPGGPPLPSDAAGGVRSLAYEAFDYGEPVEIETPAADDVIDAPEREDAGVTGVSGSDNGERGD